MGRLRSESAQRNAGWCTVRKMKLVTGPLLHPIFHSQHNGTPGNTLSPGTTPFSRLPQTCSSLGLALQTSQRATAPPRKWRATRAVFVAAIAERAHAIAHHWQRILTAMYASLLFYSFDGAHQVPIGYLNQIFQLNPETAQNEYITIQVGAFGCLRESMLG